MYVLGYSGTSCIATVGDNSVVVYRYSFVVLV